MSIHVSAITTSVIRIAGAVPIDIGISHLGCPEQEASMRIGELLLYLRDPAIAEAVADVCQGARTQTAALPHVVGISRLHLPARVGLVGTIARLGGMPRCVATWVPARPGVAQPSHLRLEVGPITWQVCDQVAWHTLGQAWSCLHRHLATSDGS